MATNVFVRNMFLGVPNPTDNRRLEVVVDELPHFGGVQFAVDTTLVSAVQGDGVPRRGAANRDGVALASARRRKAKEPTLNWWKNGRSTFVKLLAKAKVRSKPVLVQRRMEQAWRFRWSSMLACAAARSFASSFLGLRGGHSVDGQVPWSAIITMLVCVGDS